jgi:RES domain-containing protein
VRVYRLCKQDYSASVLSGEGGLHADGRWHSAGRRIVYCASSEALAILEVRVHVGRFPPKVGYAMHVIEVPDRVVRMAALDELPADWNLVPHATASQRLGNDWLAARRSVALRVPSVHGRSDFNLLVNPAHRSVASVRVLEARPFSFDARLF